MPNHPPRIVAVLPSIIPSTVIHVVQPLVRLHDTGRVKARITLETFARPRDIKNADVVIFCRNAKPRYAALLDTALTSGVPFLYDIDDDLFDLPREVDPDAHFSQAGRLAMLNRYVSSAALVRVHSRLLWDRAKKLNPHVERVSAPIDLDLITPPRPKPADSPVRIVYATSRLVDELHRIFIPALDRILSDYRGRVEADFWGPHPPVLSAANTIRHYPLDPNYERFLRRFSREGYDIGLAPLLNDAFHRAKTNTKFRDYGACRIAGIYSDVEIYSSCVQDGQTGLLVANESQAWYQALARLIEDAELRDKICQNARQYVEQHYSPREFEEILLQQIQEVLQHRPAPVLPAGSVSAACSTGDVRAPKWELISQIYSHLRPQQWPHTWDSIRWIWNSWCTIAYLRCRLSTPMTVLRRRFIAPVPRYKKPRL